MAKRKSKVTSIQVRQQAPLSVELLVEPTDIVPLPDVAAEHVRFRAAVRSVMAETARQCVETVRQCRDVVQAGTKTIEAAR